MKTKSRNTKTGKRSGLEQDNRDEKLTLDDLDTAKAVSNPANPNFKRSIPVIGIRIHPQDIELAKKIAREKGMPYQTLIKSYIHEALIRDNKKLKTVS